VVLLPLRRAARAELTRVSDSASRAEVAGGIVRSSSTYSKPIAQEAPIKTKEEKINDPFIFE
jgi:hypothetical protein